MVALLREADHPDKFDDAVTQTKNQLTEEQKQTKRTDLEKLFDAHIATLKDRGVPEQIIETLSSQKNVVVQKASGMTIGEGNVSFLPVIKPACLSYYGLMAMVRNGSKEGYTHMKLGAVTDQFETPDDLYYIYDVEDGNATRDKSPQDAEKIFKRQKRSPLTVAEVVSLCILTDVLSKHYVWALGSRDGSADRVLEVALDGGDRPRLDWDYVNFSSARWGSASCGSR